MQRRGAGFVRAVPRRSAPSQHRPARTARPTLFDAIEFNDDIACIDVLYDLAFLLMDLWHRRLPRHANAVWNGYLGETGDFEGLPLLPLFLSCRAAIRAKTSVDRGGAGGRRRRPRQARERVAREYLELADGCCVRRAPRLVADRRAVGFRQVDGGPCAGARVGPVPGAVVAAQ